MLTPVRDFWLHDDDAEVSPADLLARHRVLGKICRESILCGHRLRHELAWNCRVYFPLLDEALSRLPSVTVENITNIRVVDTFEDSDPILKENTVDFGVFLTPPTTTTTAGGKEPPIRSDDILAYCQVYSNVAINPLRNFEPHWPLAISIGTGRGAGSSENAMPQIANWARSHFRQLMYVPKLRSFADAAWTPRWLPVLPLVTVLGSKWEVSFANREGNNMVIYAKIDLGDTGTIVGCYQVYYSLARLGTCVATTFADWCASIFKKQPQAT